MTIIVNLGLGYNYKGNMGCDPKYYGKTPAAPTKGINVHMAMNGGGQLTFKEMDELYMAIQEAKVYLEAKYPLPEN